MKRSVYILVLLAVLMSCAKNEKSETIKVVTTTSFITDTVSIIAGDKIELTNLIEFGQDPHGYEPSPRDIAKVEEADLVFVNGFGLEEGLLDILEKVNNTNIIEVSQNIDPIKHSDHGEEESDPHTWLSPLNVMKWTEIIYDNLIKVDQKNLEYYNSNKLNYQKELLLLHENIQSDLSSLEHEKRVMITDHDSLAYFAREYDFVIKGTIIPNVSSNESVSAKSLISLIDLIENTKISTLFIGESSGQDMLELAESIKKELQFPVKIITLKTGSLGKIGTETDTYIDYMDYNVNQILSGLAD